MAPEVRPTWPVRFWTVGCTENVQTVRISTVSRPASKHCHEGKERTDSQALLNRGKFGSGGGTANHDGKWLHATHAGVAPARPCLR